MEWLKGKKTYITAGLAVIWALYGWAANLIAPEVAQVTIWLSLQSVFIRLGMIKKIND